MFWFCTIIKVSCTLMILLSKAHILRKQNNYHITIMYHYLIRKKTLNVVHNLSDERSDVETFTMCKSGWPHHLEN